MALTRSALALVETSGDDREWLERLGNDLVADAVAAADPLECLERVARALHKNFGLLVCGLYLMGEDGQLEQRTLVGIASARLRAAGRWDTEDSAITRCLRDGTPVFVPDATVGGARAGAASRSCFAVPLCFKGRTLGVLHLEAASARVFNVAVRTRLLKLSERVAGVIHLADMAHRLTTTTQALAAANRRLTATARKLRRLATRDALTKLANRRQFEESIGQALARQRRTGEDVALMMIDVDRFKDYNDRYGHHRGDRALARVAKALKTALRRETDFVARYGGEEFAVVVCCDASGATVVADRLCAAVRHANIRHEGTPAGCITISVGVAGAGARATRDSLVQRADRALYVAKRAGRDCARVST